MSGISQLLKGLEQGNQKILSKCITLVENQLPPYKELLEQLSVGFDTPVIGITGPPGAGKSTLINSLLSIMTGAGQKAGVLAIDPSSPFNLGALLGDRVRMHQHFGSDKVFIRSLASRGSLGGLSARAMEITDLMRAAGFDWIIVETVGVGQSEVEIAGLADVTVLVLVPESGDAIQIMKAGILEIADIYVVNKADRPGAKRLVKELQVLSHGREGNGGIPIVKTIATDGKGTETLLEKIREKSRKGQPDERKVEWLARKAYRIIADQRMKDIDQQALREEITQALNSREPFNLYRFLDRKFS